MMMFILPLLLLPLALSELIFVSVIWRHGDRAPGDLPYPLDKHNVSAWPRGWNQLTNEGIEQTSDLGKWLRKRYMKKTHHINSVFDKDEVLVLSSDSERALCSAQAVMESLFAPDDEFVWKKKLDWQPTPIHSIGEDRDDPLLKPTSVDCPAYDKIKEADSLPLFKSLTDGNQPLFDMLTKNTGMEINASNVDNLYDITREIAHDLKQPKWVTKDVIAKISEFKRLIRNNDFNSPQKSRLRGGYLLGDWHSRINAISSGDKKAMKTILYSSHDGTLSALLNVLNVSNNQLVPYAAAIIAELHRVDGQDQVQFWYRNDTSSSKTDPVKLTIPNCDFSCPLSTFNSIVAPLTINTTQQLTKLCTSAA